MKNIGSSRFFDSTQDDIRTYSANDLAEYFAAFYATGVVGEDSLKTEAKAVEAAAAEKVTVTIAPGKAVINGYLYLNKDTETIDIAKPATSTKYWVGLCLDLDTRAIYTTWVTDEPQETTNKIYKPLYTFTLDANSTVPKDKSDKRVFSKGLFTEDLTAVKTTLQSIVNNTNNALKTYKEQADEAVSHITSLSDDELKKKVENIINADSPLDLNAAYLDGYSKGSFWTKSELTLKSLGGNKIFNGTEVPSDTIGNTGDIYVMYEEG